MFCCLHHLSLNKFGIEQQIFFALSAFKSGFISDS